MKKIIITIIILIIIGLGVMNLYFYQEVKSLKQVTDIKKEPTNHIITELTGNLISFDQNKNTIEMFSKEFNKNIIVTYNTETFFYIHEIMSDERYQKAFADYEKKINEVNKQMNELNDSQIDNIIMDPSPIQDLFNQKNLIDDLNLTKDDSLVVPFKETNPDGQYIAINIIKNSFIN